MVGRGLGNCVGAIVGVGLSDGSGLGLYVNDGWGDSGVGTIDGAREKMAVLTLLVSTVAPTFEVTSETKLAEVNVVARELKNSAGVETPVTAESDVETTNDISHV
jgi:hypothetical protein